MLGRVAIQILFRAGVGVSLACALASCSRADPQAKSLPAHGELAYEVEYATYFGGPADERAREVIVYPDGSILVGMQAMSRGLPTTPGAFQPQYAGDDPNQGHPGRFGGDLYLVRLDASGKRVLAATYFGGSKQERNAYGMDLDPDGNVVVSSSTRSRDLPTTPGVAQRRFGGGETDWFVAKLSPDLQQLRWCTYLGGRNKDTPRGGHATDPAGRVVVVGSSPSPDFPGRRGAANASAFVVWLSPDGALERTVPLAGSKGGVVVGVRINDAGEVYIAGHTKSPSLAVTPGAAQPRSGGRHDNFLMKLSAEGEILYSTYQGGSGNEFAEHRLGLGADGTVYLAGATNSKDFPTTPGAFQPRPAGLPEGFVLVLEPDGKRFRWSSYLGGTGEDVYLMPTVDEAGRVFVVGRTGGPDYPVTENALQLQNAGGLTDGAMAVFSPDGSQLVYSTFLGGSGEDWIRSLAIGPSGEIYLVGRTRSRDFPVTPNALQRRHAGGFDAFIVKLVPKAIVPAADP